MKKQMNIAMRPITREMATAATELAMFPKRLPKAMVLTASPPNPLGSRLLKKYPSAM